MPASMMKAIRITLAAGVLAASFPAAAVPARSEPVAARVDHLALHVADLDTSVAFYREIFGFQPVPAGATALWLDLGGFQLHLIGGRADPVGTPKAVHFAIAVDSLEAVAARLTARGHVWGDYQGQPGVVSTARTDGVRQIFVQDPDGYWIEVNDRRVAP